MDKAEFDGALSISLLITLDSLMEDLPDEHKQRFIREYEEEDPEEWAEYLEYRREMDLPEL
jgi:hypothetical protein